MTILTDGAKGVIRNSGVFDPLMMTLRVSADLILRLNEYFASVKKMIACARTNTRKL